MELGVADQSKGTLICEMEPLKDTIAWHVRLFLKMTLVEGLFMYLYRVNDIPILDVLHLFNFTIFHHGTPTKDDLKPPIYKKYLF